MTAQGKLTEKIYTERRNAVVCGTISLQTAYFLESIRGKHFIEVLSFTRVSGVAGVLGEANRHFDQTLSGLHHYVGPQKAPLASTCTICASGSGPERVLSN